MCRLAHGWIGRQEEEDKPGKLENGGRTRIYQGVVLQTTATGNLGLAGSAQFAIPASAAAT